MRRAPRRNRFLGALLVLVAAGASPLAAHRTDVSGRPLALQQPVEERISLAQLGIAEHDRIELFPQEKTRLRAFDFAGEEQPQAIERLGLEIASGRRDFYLFDALGSPVDLMKPDGSLAVRYQWDAWGQLRKQTGESFNAFGFTGYERDEETGLFYAKARFYDPEAGRFLSEDPFEGIFDQPPSLHKYLYAHANPTVYTDPSGRCVGITEGPCSALAADLERELEQRASTGNERLDRANRVAVQVLLSPLTALLRLGEGLGHFTALLHGSVTDFDPARQREMLRTGEFQAALLGATGDVAVVAPALQAMGGTAANAARTASARVLEAVREANALARGSLGLPDLRLLAAEDILLLGGLRAGARVQSVTLGESAAAPGATVAQAQAVRSAPATPSGATISRGFAPGERMPSGMLAGEGPGAALAGTIKRPILLGESMKTRVLPVADELGAATFKPRSVDPTRWKINQRRWIREQIREGRQVYDIGVDRTRSARSEYYAIERQELLDAGYERVFRRWVTVNVSGRAARFRLYEWVPLE